jgi:hypothetical protein
MNVILLREQRHVKEVVRCVCADFTLSSAEGEELDKAVITATIYISGTYRIVYYVVSWYAVPNATFIMQSLISGQSLLTL